MIKQLIMLAVGAILAWAVFITVGYFHSETDRAILWREQKSINERVMKTENLMNGYLIDKMVEAIRKVR